MGAVQPDLFGELDARVEQARRDREPQKCPFCGVTEPNVYLLRTNHGPDDLGSTMRQQCMAQFLVTNHIKFSARRLAEATDKMREQARAQHVRDVERGHELGLDVDAIAAAALEGDAR